MGIKNIAVFASGGGTNAENIARHFASGDCGRVILIASTKQGTPVLVRAQKLGISSLVLEKDAFTRTEVLLAELENRKIDFIALAGFLWLVPNYLICSYRGRIVNIHPALLPRYGGKGMYGLRVHEAVLRARDVESGITIHHVNEHYDEGTIIFQAKCPVLPGDTPLTLQEKVHLLEYKHYPVVIEKLLMDTGASELR